MGFFRSNSTTTELPTPKKPEPQRPPSYASSRSSTHNDMKTAAVVGSNCPCHTRYGAMKIRIQDVSKKLNKTCPSESLERGRFAGLMGIMNAPVEPCDIFCCCHDEMQILATELKRQVREHDQVRREAKTPAQQRSFEAYAGEIRYLDGMIRECKGQTKPPAPSVDVTAALRSAIQRLEVKVEVLKNRVHELELKEGM